MKLLFQLATYRPSNQLPLAGLQSTRRQTDHRFDKVSIKCAVVEWGGGGGGLGRLGYGLGLPPLFHTR